MTQIDQQSFENTPEPTIEIASGPGQHQVSNFTSSNIEKPTNSLLSEKSEEKENVGEDESKQDE